MQGVYRGVFRPLNPKIIPKLSGSVTLAREKDDFIADVRVAHGPVSTLLSQTLHEGTRCPDEKDDENQDGYIDAEEAYVPHKGVLVTLDDDLSSLRMGLGIYPVTDEFGYYFWSRGVSFEKLLSDLRDEDINPEDEFVKIPSSSTLDPRNLVVILRGIATSENLPFTVKGRGRQSVQQSLPIGCAILTKVNSTPGVIDQDETDLPVPSGETVGGSGGADDGADFPESRVESSTGDYGEDGEKE